VPAIWFVAPAGAATALMLMLGLPGNTWLRLAIWGAIGLCVYFLYSVHHSRVSRAATPKAAGAAVVSRAR
jgi:APA family basic amino acid/polyamine antiporter